MHDSEVDAQARRNPDCAPLAHGGAEPWAAIRSHS